MLNSWSRCLQRPLSGADKELQEFTVGLFKQGIIRPRAAGKRAQLFNLSSDGAIRNLEGGRCVELLLSTYTMQTAQEAHYTLAEPDIWVDKWRNTAFHCAAYRGNAKCLSLLLSFAKQHTRSGQGLL